MVNPELISLLAPALGPCAGFKSGPCQTACRWEPKAGHVPRGFAGAKSFDLKDVLLVVVTAEPGDPDDHEAYSGSPSEMIKAHIDFVETVLGDPSSLRRNGRPAHYHQNLRRILDLCWPDLALNEQLQRTWLTNAVLCSARISGKSVPRAVEQFCVQTYLRPQIDLFPNAFILSLGGKSKRRLSSAGIRISACAQHPSARANTNPLRSWEEAAEEFRAWL